MGVVENHMLYQKSAVFAGRASCSDSVCSGNISVIVFALRRSAVSGWAIRSRAHSSGLSWNNHDSIAPVPHSAVCIIIQQITPHKPGKVPTASRPSGL